MIADNINYVTKTVFAKFIPQSTWIVLKVSMNVEITD